MSREEYQAIVAAIEARRTDEDWYQAGALATAVAYRIDQRIRELDVLTTYLARTPRKKAA